MRIWPLCLTLVVGCGGSSSAEGPCGDGRVDSREACDDGNTASGDGCSSACEIERACPAPPCGPRCGDGALSDGEGCDDGNVLGEDGCSPTCAVVSGWTCDVTSPTACRARLGDGVVILGQEACDDGNQTAGDGCDGSARREIGWSCDESQPTVCQNICGDSRMVGRETCDDGNTENLDGCSSVCQKTDRWERLAGRVSLSAREWTVNFVKGSQVFVWGGYNLSQAGDGAIYDTDTGEWSRISPIDAPAPRSRPFFAWTGSEVIVWSGMSELDFHADGAIYNPTTDTWRPISTEGAPVPGLGDAVWTGTEMLFLEFDDNQLPESSGYNPTTDTWRRLSTVGAPSSQAYPTTLEWTGREMIAWGVRNSEGALYDPARDTWRPMSSVGAPEWGASLGSEWIGSELIVWGRGESGLTTGGRYDPETDVWTPLPTLGAPSPRELHTMVWTGSELIVWGGRGTDGAALDGGARYIPAIDAWVSLPEGAPVALMNPTATWTGTKMFVWGGGDGFNTFHDEGALYDPAVRRWARIEQAPGPSQLDARALVADGEDVLLFGTSQGDALAYRYSRTDNAWTRLSDAPEASYFIDYAARSGSEVITWGSSPRAAYGARYTPSEDRWTPLAAGGAPSSRYQSNTAWTGSELIVWGGVFNGEGLRNGAIYDGETDSWRPMSRVGAPSARVGSTGLWTGSELIVFGGIERDGGPLTDGSARYDPRTDCWTALASAGEPALRYAHSATWIGTEMVVFGGLQGPYSDPTFVAGGGAYDPATDRWRALSADAAPSARFGHAALWNGREILVWSGAVQKVRFGYELAHDGARYDPLRDRWTPISAEDAPRPVLAPSSVWLGDRMMLWGGRTEVPSITADGGGFYEP